MVGPSAACVAGPGAPSPAAVPERWPGPEKPGGQKQPALFASHDGKEFDLACRCLAALVIAARLQGSLQRRQHLGADLLVPGGILQQGIGQRGPLRVAGGCSAGPNGKGRGGGK